MMPGLVYTGNTSLDGFVFDENRNFDWTAPSSEVLGFINDLERGVGTYLYGRRMYETMQIWETLPLDDVIEPMRDYAELWRAADKVVFSRTLDSVSTARTRVDREFDPAAILTLMTEADRPVSIGGATLAAQAIRAGLVDEFHQFVYPVIVGGGTSYLPLDVRLDLQLIDERRFADGVVFLHYRTKA